MGVVGGAIQFQRFGSFAILFFCSFLGRTFQQCFSPVNVATTCFVRQTMKHENMLQKSYNPFQIISTILTAHK